MVSWEQGTEPRDKAKETPNDTRTKGVHLAYCEIGLKQV